MFGSLDVSTSALTAYRTQLDVIAGNVAMKDVMTRDAAGNAEPYRRRVALLAPNDGQSGNGPGVHVASVVEDPFPFESRWAPQDPNAHKSGEHEGYVLTSNVDYQTEMVNAMTAARAYEANITVMEMTKRMASTTLRLIG